MGVCSTWKMTVINVCACIQAAVAAVNLSGGAWIEYVPWKLHDVGQRLLLADKKTEEGWTGRWGKKGDEKQQGMNGEVGATSTSYFAHTVRWDPWCRVVARPAISFVRQVMTKKREFLGRIALSERHFGTSFTYMRRETYLTIVANNRARSLKAKNQGMNVEIIQTFEVNSCYSWR